MQAAKPRSSKIEKVKPRIPRGFVDRRGREIAAVDGMMAAIRQVYELYGFEPLETPLFEYTDALGKFLPDQDRPNSGVFSLQDEDGQWLSLRYDLTAPLARFVAENYQHLPKPYRSYRFGPVFRNEKPGPDRFRQFMQFDADTVGAASIAADAEMCMMAAEALQSVGLSKDDFVIHLNNRKLLDGAMEMLSLSGEAHKETRLTVLRAIDKLDKFPLEEVKQLLGPGRQDESGDFTKGAGLAFEAIDVLVGFLNIGILKESAGHSNAHILRMLRASPLMANARFCEGVEELAALTELTEAAGYDSAQIAISPHVVRGLEYYTGPVFEASLTFEVENEKGKVVRFGSVGGGGRYDGLIGRFRSEAVPATGFSIGVSRLLTALRQKGLARTKPSLGPVVVLVMDRGELVSSQAIACELRAAGVCTELYLGNAKNFGKQLAYADKRGAPAVVIEGSSERSMDQVQVKDLILGKRLAQDIEDNALWRTQNPAQQTVAREDLVETVKALLARYS